MITLRSITKLTKRFYVYILYDNDMPFYIGKGTGKRSHEHLREAKRGHACHKCSRIRKVWRECRDVTIRYVYQTDAEWRAFKRERDLIAQIGIENLTNLTYGGEGWSRYYTPQEIARKEFEAIAGARRIRAFLAREERL